MGIDPRVDIGHVHLKVADLEAGITLEGASDHGVSEALYLRDPDGNGVELYSDRPRDEWPPQITTLPLDVRALLAEAG